MPRSYQNLISVVNPKRLCTTGLIKYQPKYLYESDSMSGVAYMQNNTGINAKSNYSEGLDGIGLKKSILAQEGKG